MFFSPRHSPIVQMCFISFTLIFYLFVERKPNLLVIFSATKTWNSQTWFRSRRPRETQGRSSMVRDWENHAQKEEFDFRKISKIIWVNYYLPFFHIGTADSNQMFSVNSYTGASSPHQMSLLMSPYLRNTHHTCLLAFWYKFSDVTCGPLQLHLQVHFTSKMKSNNTCWIYEKTYTKYSKQAQYEAANAYHGQQTKKN